jgi:hypothetical protein
MLTWFVVYLAATGFAANSIRVARHLGKAGMRASEGNLRAAGGELVAAALAPANAVIHLVKLLVGEVAGVLCRNRAEDEVREGFTPFDGFRIPVARELTR